MIEIKNICIGADQTLRDAMARIDRTAAGIALVVDEKRRLLFTITDGDIRRAILHGLNPDMTVRKWATRLPEQGNVHPTTAPLGTSEAELKAIMLSSSVSHIPLTDADGRVEALVTKDELQSVAEHGIKAVLMAGGEGTRLRPLTNSVPKPMLPVAGRPLMEHIVRQLGDAGIRRVSVATHYKSQHIAEHFRDGRDFGLRIDYLQEERPLGTAGALSMLEPWSSSLLVMNSDVLTGLNYRALFEFHREMGGTMTVAVRQYHVEVPYGVVDTAGVEIKGLREKPVMQFFVNAGVYLLEPRVRDFLQADERLDMTELIHRLLKAGDRVVSFPISEYWLDIGKHEDYMRAQQDDRDGNLPL